MNMSVAQVAFPSLTVVKGPIEDQGKVLLQVITYGEVTIDTLKSKNAPKNGEFLPAAVKQANTTLWQFSKQHPDYRIKNGLAKLGEVDGELVIYLHHGELLDLVFPVADAPKIRWLPDGTFVGGRSRDALVALKEAVAKTFALEPVWNAREHTVLSKQAERRRAAVEAERKAEEAERNAARERRREKAASILKRPKLKAQTLSDGKHRSGVPVVGNEWESVTHATFCISVESYDETTMTAGPMIEAFQVIAHGSRKNRHRVTAVKPYGEPTVALAVADTLPSFTVVVISIDDHDHDAFEMASFDDVKALRAHGYTGVYATYTEDGKKRACRIEQNGITMLSTKHAAVSA